MRQSLGRREPERNVLEYMCTGRRRLDDKFVHNLGCYKKISKMVDVRSLIGYKLGPLL